MATRDLPENPEEPSEIPDSHRARKAKNDQTQMVVYEQNPETPNGAWVKGTSVDPTNL